MIWTASWQNQQNGICTQRRRRSAWASAQSDQSLLSARKKLELPIERTAKTNQTGLIHSEDSDETVILLVLSWGGSYVTVASNNNNVIARLENMIVSGCKRLIWVFAERKSYFFFFLLFFFFFFFCFVMLWLIYAIARLENMIVSGRKRLIWDFAERKSYLFIFFFFFCFVMLWLIYVIARLENTIFQQMPSWFESLPVAQSILSVFGVLRFQCNCQVGKYHRPIKLPPIVYATDHSKAVVLVLFLFCVALWIVLLVFHVESCLALCSRVFSVL